MLIDKIKIVVGGGILKSNKELIDGLFQNLKSESLSRYELHNWKNTLFLFTKDVHLKIKADYDERMDICYVISKEIEIKDLSELLSEPKSEYKTISYKVFKVGDNYKIKDFSEIGSPIIAELTENTKESIAKAIKMLCE